MEAALTALLASVAGGRRYWGRAPQSAARPFLVLNKIGAVPDYHYGGASGYVSTRVQIDIYADKYTAATDTANAIKAILSGYRGGAILGIFIDSQRDLPAADAGEANHLFRTSIDFTIHYQET